MTSDLGQRLVRDGVLAEETVRSAAARQLVYGGALDTALLEMGVVDEATIWGSMARASGLPVPPPALMERADPAVAATFDTDRSETAALAVPLARDGNRVQVLCADPVDAAALRQRADELGLDVELYIAPEVRVRVAAQMALGQPMPPRFLRLLARLVGAQAARRWLRSPEPAAPPLPSAPIVVTVTVAAQRPPEIGDAARKATGEEPPRSGEPPPSPPPRSTGTRRTMPRPALRENEPSRPTRPRRSVTPATSVADDPGATVEGMAPLQQVMQLAPAMAEPSEAAVDGEAAVEPPAAPAARPTKPGRDASPTADRPIVDRGVEESVFAAAESGAGEERVAALRRLRGSLDHPRVAALALGLREDIANAPSDRAVAAATALGELRDPAAVPALLARLGEHDAPLTAAVRGALVEITKQDLGTSARRWRTWWTRHQSDDRIDWLFDGLSHKAPEIRYSSSEDLRLLTGQYFGYHYDLPKREREEARARWESWWIENRR